MAKNWKLPKERKYLRAIVQLATLLDLIFYFHISPRFSKLLKLETSASYLKNENHEAESQRSAECRRVDFLSGTRFSSLRCLCASLRLCG